MKWQLTGRYLVSIVLIVVIVIVMNITAVIALLVMNSGFLAQTEGNFAESMTRSFGQYIQVSPSGISVSDGGKELLVRHQAWIQVLDEDGRQLYSYRAPEGAKTKYTPLDIIDIYKYLEVNYLSTVFVGEKKVQNLRYSYLIGFKDPNLRRVVVALDIRNTGQILKNGSLVLIVLDGLIALFIGYLFSKRLTQPLYVLIEAIKRMANKNYKVQYKPEGVYKDVFLNVNLLSSELQANEIERKKLDRMKEEWIGNISHDIKTPLSSIQGYAEMIKDSDYQFSIEEIREYAEIIERKSLYLKEVIEDLNLSTRLKNKELALKLKNVNIVSLVRNIVIDILNDAMYASRNIDFHCSDEVIVAEVDDILIRRAVANIIYNSIVHNDEAVQIQVSVETSGSDAIIRVEDNGKGIKEEEIERIFDRYYRGTNTGELHKGSGLGMAITNDIIVAHKGKIQVSSAPHQGTRIEIRLILP
ncbi:sensor histidine kinase [Paenibacillus sepulcri]|uniref:histidine kinase n=1 Tax=Paenibacillus sepulcri TaxID=359917 RepID=A0ABS7BVY6_9BACL|nr:HAMP domain-containing histidine kinase [Paenibacillus sepulcri]